MYWATGPVLHTPTMQNQGLQAIGCRWILHIYTFLRASPLKIAESRMRLFATKQELWKEKARAQIKANFFRITQPWSNCVDLQRAHVMRPRAQLTLQAANPNSERTRIGCD